MIITNNYTTQAECIATVRDCSTGEYKFSYRTIGITALTLKKKMPIPCIAHQNLTVGAAEPITIWYLFSLEIVAIQSCYSNYMAMLNSHGWSMV